MKLMTATEASRNFAAVLDAAEHGETIVITRAGRRLALVGPAPTGNGGALNDALAGHRPDDRFAEDVSGARDLLTDEPGAQWPDA
ncbi:type II toxin-antitoxin system prevent-host-death family antitoxin [Actinacidiphila sp. DG2A-62]|jgi:prevent-host-death family protein|uniref:type II toxin-antitoxin system Phd/YefM family antitoxin n=1 Tax=Actinacidiphila sp. DG2A-62 TaxID=3108821 RepID=UPI002DBF96EC|nr:type II toxin-antitoxin system prevent-host-death family antitoxin [Actinacidiphila sp. DG2A-62]MEC3995103.1 type II toxin-antitoxin system prevent-host-death family antitoxin [Actinacidiphila sp. DG2A-62]